MLRHYFLTAVRTASRQKLHTLISLVGLVIGVATSTLIYLWVLDELSYDSFHANADTLYRIEQDQHGSAEVFHVNITKEPMAQAVQEEIPEIVAATRFGFLGEVLVRQGETAIYEGRSRYVDPTFLSMLSFPLIEGDSVTALKDPSSVVITSSLAMKLFNRDTGIIGQALTLNNEHRLVVSGVARDVPTNSTLQFNLLVSSAFASNIGVAGDSWRSNEVLTYVQLGPSAIASEAAEKISALNYFHTSDGADAADLPKTEKGTPAWRAEYMLRPLVDVYLTGYFGYGRSAGRIQYVYILSAIGLVVLLIACINFMNLSISRSTRRAREVGLRKTVGAVRAQLALQYFGETVGISLLAAALGLAIVMLLLPSFNAWSNKQLAVDLLGDSHLLPGLLAIVLVTAIVAGIYPALILSAFKPRAFLGGQVAVTPFGQLLRRLTVTVQFIISAVLLIGTGVVFEQTKYMNSKDLGYDTQNLLWFQLRDNMRSNYEVFRQQALADQNIVAVTGSWQHPAFNSANGGIDWPGKTEDNAVPVGINFVDYEYIETMGLDIIEGRSFDRQRPGDSGRAFVINEEFAELITEGPVIGATVAGDGTVIGVARSFHRTSLRRAIEPTILAVDPARINMVLVRLNANSPAEGRAAVEREFGAIFPEYPFDFSFFEDDLGMAYRAQEELLTVLQVAGLVAIIVACLGMFGLASFAAERRRKEMAVRKVLGASSRRLFGMLSREYLVIVGLANLVAAPLAYYLAQNWLRDFAFRIDFDPWLIGLAGVMTVLIALVAISSHSIRAARNNPASVLKTE